jgi:hypothetical protein
LCCRFSSRNITPRHNAITRSITKHLHDNSKQRIS